HLRGGARVLAGLKEELASEIAAGLLHVEGVSCLGQCDRAPAGVIDRARHDGPPAREEHTCAPVALETLRPLLRPAAAAPPAEPPLLPEVHTLKEAEGRHWFADVYRGRPDYRVVRAFDQQQEADRQSRRLSAIEQL